MRGEVLPTKTPVVPPQGCPEGLPDFGSLVSCAPPASGTQDAQR